jgi:hypothetical protein
MSLQAPDAPVLTLDDLAEALGCLVSVLDEAAEAADEHPLTLAGLRRLHPCEVHALLVFLDREPGSMTAEGVRAEADALRGCWP